MPRSSNPAVLVFAALYLLMGAFFLAIGVTFLIGFDLGMIIGIPATVGGASAVVGAVGLVKQWRRSIRGEKDTADSMRRTVASGAALPADGVLAHWVYDREEWKAYRKRESAYRRMQAVTWALLIMIGVTIAGVAASGDVAVGMAMGAVLGALAGGAQWIRAASANRANRSTPLPDAIIGRSSLLFNGRYHVLQDHQYDFGGVRLLEEEQPPILEFTVTWKTRKGGRSDARIRVPVPRGHDEEARKIVAEYPRVGTGAVAPALVPAG